MRKLTAIDCLWPHVVRVLEENRPETRSPRMVFAVFAKSIDTGIFCGLATADDINRHPDWIFADLVEHRPLVSITPNAGVRLVLKLFEREGLEALPVLGETDNFIGAVTRLSILQAMLRHERSLLLETRRLNRLLSDEHKQVVSWSEHLSNLHEASRTLLGVLAHTSLETDLLQAGIDALCKLLGARYGAIGILAPNGTLKHFIYSGIESEVAEKIGRLPLGRGLLGVVVHENTSLRLDDMSKDPRSAGFPEHHPQMKSLLAVPVSHGGRVYGRIYLCDKENSEPFSPNDEILAKSFAHSLSLVLDNAREMEEINRARQSLTYMAHFDALTDLPNRTLLEDRIRQALTHARRYSLRLAILFIDLDNFKAINDTLSHQVGDLLLKQAAGKISACLREDDTVARQGGDEFIVLLRNIVNSRDAAQVSQKILSALENPFDIKDHEAFIGASIGISIFPDNADNIETLLANADAAMYHAKRLGKNNYQFFNEDMNYAARRAQKLEKHLRQALHLHELEIYYQAQVQAKSGKIIGMEALLRWHNDEFGHVSPADFIPLAEETGLIVSIGEWVLHEACAQAKRWQQAGKPTRVSVNLSSRQFQNPQRHNPYQLFDTVKSALDKSGLPPDLLELEITESIMMQHVDITMTVINRLKGLGVRFSVDDFGTGYSSLSYLKKFPIDTLKIDKSFIADIIDDPNDNAIVSAITVMAKRLKLEVIAEGVETIEQLDFLRNLRCDTIQGYYFSKPIPGDEAFLLLNNGFGNGP
ncbi:MAG TPA: diguanylate cyclase [Methylococcaceae bacterium]|nr:diguanylate cyclase [Methylococcaceae bacterium]